MRFGFRAVGIARRLTLADGLYLVIAALVVILYVATSGSGFPLDDSWIHQTYGRNLAHTGQWAFVPGIPSAASTSPLYTVLLAVGYKLGLPYIAWTHALGVLALAATGMLGARMAEQIRGAVEGYSRALPKNRSLIAFLTGLSLIVAWHLIWSAASGMETMLFSMFTLLLIHRAWREVDGTDESRSHSPQNIAWRGVGVGALAALATLTRPEGVMLAGLIGASMLVVCPHGSGRGTGVWAVGVVAGFVLVISPYLLLNLQLTGGLLPNTAAAKQAENAPLLDFTYPQRIINLIFPLIAGGQVLLVPGIAFFVFKTIRHLRQKRVAFLLLLPLLWAAALIGLYAAHLPAPYQHGRYVIPSLPSLVLTGTVGTIWLVQSGRSSPAGRVLSRSLALSAALGFLYFGLVAGPSVYRVDVAIINEEMVATARWIADHLPPDELLVVHDIGAVGYFAPRPILDLAGLVSPEVVPIILDKEPLYALMRQRDARYLMAFPDQVPGDDVNDPRLCSIFTTNGPTSRSVSGPNMTVYRLAWDGICSTSSARLRIPL